MCLGRTELKWALCWWQGALLLIEEFEPKTKGLCQQVEAFH